MTMVMMTLAAGTTARQLSNEEGGVLDLLNMILADAVVIVTD